MSHLRDTSFCPTSSGLPIAPSGKNNACPKHRVAPFPASPPAVRGQQAQRRLHRYPDPLDPGAAFEEQCWASGSRAAMANLGAGVGSDVMVTGAVPTPGRAPTLTRCITSTIKTLGYSQACNVSSPKSPTQQIRFSVKFLLSELQRKRESPASKRCLCNCTGPHFCASSLCNHLPCLCFLSPPSELQLKRKAGSKVTAGNFSCCMCTRHQYKAIKNIPICLSHRKHLFPSSNLPLLPKGDLEWEALGRHEDG